MSVVSLMGVTPSARFDGVVWYRALIQESATSTGPWVQIQNLILAPPDTDPTDPEPRNFSFEGNIDEGGWYRVVFADQAGNQLQPSAPIQNHLGYAPTKEQVARKILSRTRDQYGNLKGTFDETTTPTGEVVNEIIVDAVSQISKSIGDIIPDSLTADASDVVALYAAMQIELTVFAEQVNTGRSIYPQLEKQMNGAPGILGALVRLQRAITISEAGTGAIENAGPSLMPSFGGFPDPQQYPPIGLGTRW